MFVDFVGFPDFVFGLMFVNCLMVDSYGLC